MSNSTDTIELTPADLARAEHKLTDMVTNIEFTMISIIAGLMLFPLIEAATPLVRTMQVEYWIYPLLGLELVMFFWTGLVRHSLTFVGWPIDTIHNLIYLLLFPVVGITLHLLNDPAGFYSMFSVVVLIALLLVTYDLRLMAERRRNARGAAIELLTVTHDNQRRLAYITAIAFLLSLIGCGLVLGLPGLFIEGHWHLALGFIYFFYLGWLLMREHQRTVRIRPGILHRTAEELIEDARRQAFWGNIGRETTR